MTRALVIATVLFAAAGARAQPTPAEEPTFEVLIDQVEDHEVRILDASGVRIERCRGKCRLQLPVGEYELRSSRARGHLPIPYRVEGPGAIRLGIRSRRGLRIFGKFLPALFAPAVGITKLETGRISLFD